MDIFVTMIKKNLKTAFNDNKHISAHIFASINRIIKREVSQFLS